MKISIAMATYNGGQYLREQLDSFLQQERLPDELIVCDDGSSDETMVILEQYAAQAPFVVKVVRNPDNLGYADNFAKAIGLCTGDLIFLSDQDDVWLPRKLKLVAAHAERNPEVLLVMNDAEIVLADGRPTGLSKLGQTRALGLGDQHFVTGCCMAIRRSALDLFLPVPAGWGSHDSWIGRLAIALGARTIIPEVMQLYRRHGANASSTLTSRTEKLGRLDLVRELGDKDSREPCLRRLAQLEQLRERLSVRRRDIGAGSAMMAKLSPVLQDIAREKAAVEARWRILGQSRWCRLWPAWLLWRRGGYDYFSGWKSLLKDLLKH